VKDVAPEIAWPEVEAWDRAYYLHSTQSQAEYAFLAVARQDGNWLTLADGTRLLDFQSQLISDSLGHRHPRIYDEIQRAMQRYGHVFFGMATDYRARAAKLVVEDILGGASGWAGRLRVLASGTEAVESCIAMARLYTGRQVILTQAHSFHGMAVGASMLRGYRNNLTPEAEPQRVRDVPGFPVAGYIPIPAPEHEAEAASSPLPSLAATESIIRAVGPENIAAVITEPMFGAAGLPAHRDYLPGLVSLARKYGFLWIDDEILCGFGRLGEWFGYQHHAGVHPDLMAVGKSINGCALPAGGVIASKPIADHFERARWWSGSTWDGHPIVCASIVGAIEAMLEEKLVDRVRTQGAYLRERLVELQARHASFGRFGGAGLYFAVDLVDGHGEPIVREDRWTAFRGTLSDQPNNVIGRECARRGVLLGGFVPNTIKVAPPFTVTREEIDLGIAAFDGALGVLDRMYC